MTNNKLRHWGIPGMKWGRRKATHKLVFRSDDNRVARDLTKHGAKDLSNKQLQTVINRIELEKRYNQITGANRPTKSAQAKEMVTGILLQAGQQVAMQYTSRLLSQGVGAFLKAKGLG